VPAIAGVSWKRAQPGKPGAAKPRVLAFCRESSRN
jgi:hypothetical protein